MMGNLICSTPLLYLKLTHARSYGGEYQSNDPAGGFFILRDYPEFFNLNFVLEILGSIVSCQLFSGTLL